MVVARRVGPSIGSIDGLVSSTGGRDDPFDRPRLPERPVGATFDVLVDGADGAHVPPERLYRRLELCDAGLDVVEAVRSLQGLLVGQCSLDRRQSPFEGVAVVVAVAIVVVLGNAARWPRLPV